MRNIVFLVALGLLLAFAQAAPYQELEPRKGHVPVYIRHGDEPLNEIHLGLAEAFKEGPESESSKPESLVNEVPQAETTIGTNSEPTTTPAPASSSTESDIASFEAIKAMME